MKHNNIVSTTDIARMQEFLALVMRDMATDEIRMAANTKFGAKLDTVGGRRTAVCCTVAVASSTREQKCEIMIESEEKDETILDAVGEGMTREKRETKVEDF